MSGKVRKIQDFDRVYYLLRILMEAALKRAYCRIEYAGRDRILAFLLSGFLRL